jgi:hypothetical protein
MISAIKMNQINVKNIVKIIIYGSFFCIFHGIHSGNIP